MSDVAVLAFSVVALVVSAWSFLTCRRACLDAKARLAFVRARAHREGIIP